MAIEEDTTKLGDRLSKLNDAT